MLHITTCPSHIVLTAMFLQRMIYGTLATSLFLSLLNSNMKVEAGILTSLSRFFTFFYQLFYRQPPPQTAMSTPQLIQYYGYKVEEHRVQTEDGYILTLFRIPYQKSTRDGPHDKSTKGRPVLLQHGSICSSDDWLLLPPNVALPFLLVNEGHDVWLGNFRGNKYSTKHIQLDPSELKFWDFSQSDFGDYDVPATISYILAVTKYKQLNWIGHSIGGTELMFALTTFPELNKKVRKLVSIGAPYYYRHISFVYRLKSMIPSRIVQEFLNSMDGGHFFSSRMNELLKKHGPAICYGEIPRELCMNIIFLIGGFNREQMTAETVSMVVGHSPSDTSDKAVTHGLQNYKAGVARRFDYGIEENWKRYGSPSPPGYDLPRITVPIQAWCAPNDLRNPVTDCVDTVKELQSVDEMKVVTHSKWTHLDFLYGKDAKVFVYDDVLKYLKE